MSTTCGQFFQLCRSRGCHAVSVETFETRDSSIGYSAWVHRGDDIMRMAAPSLSDLLEDVYDAVCADIGWTTPYDVGLRGGSMLASWSDAGKEEWRRGDHDRVTRDREAS